MNKNTKTAAKSRRQVGALPYKVVDHAARTGKRVSTRGMTSREFKEALLGNLPPR